MGFSLEAGVSAFTVFFQGLLSFFSPCVLPLLPLYIGSGQGSGSYVVLCNRRQLCILPAGDGNDSSGDLFPLRTGVVCPGGRSPGDVVRTLPAGVFRSIQGSGTGAPAAVSYRSAGDVTFHGIADGIYL